MDNVYFGGSLDPLILLEGGSDPLSFWGFVLNVVFFLFAGV